MKKRGLTLTVTLTLTLRGYENAIVPKWLGEEGTMDCRLLHFIFKNVLFFVYCTEQNTKEIIWQKNMLSHKNMKKRRSFLKWYDSKTYLR